MHTVFLVGSFFFFSIVKSSSHFLAWNVSAEEFAVRSLLGLPYVFVSLATVSIIFFTFNHEELDYNISLDKLVSVESDWWCSYAWICVPLSRFGNFSVISSLNILSTPSAFAGPAWTLIDQILALFMLFQSFHKLSSLLLIPFPSTKFIFSNSLSSNSLIPSSVWFILLLIISIMLLILSWCSFQLKNFCLIL